MFNSIQLPPIVAVAQSSGSRAPAAFVFTLKHLDKQLSVLLFCLSQQQSAHSIL